MWYVVLHRNEIYHVLQIFLGQYYAVTYRELKKAIKEWKHIFSKFVLLVIIKD